MCEIYSVGVDEMYGSEVESVIGDDRIAWLVYAYEIGDYSGSGEAVAYNKEDGMLYCMGLGHCSCYGPMDGGLTGATKITVDEFLREKDNVLEYDSTDAVKNKVRELLS